MPAPGWASVSDGLAFAGGLTLSFQRFLPAECAGAAPPSLGVLPVAAADEGLFLVPIYRAEAAWLGLLRATQADAVTLAGVGWVGARSLDLMTGAVSTLAEATPFPAVRFHLVPGLPNSRFALPRDPSGSDACRLLAFAAAAGGEHPVQARVRLVDPDEYRRRTGLAAPPPADPDAAYKGWLLP